jgi:hypothetical protein
LARLGEQRSTPYVFSVRPNILSGLGLSQDENLAGSIRFNPRVFLHHDGVGAGRQGRAGEQPHAGAGRNFAREDLPGGDLSCQAQAHRRSRIG